ncbi:hypothetical protein C8D87_11155 [Lentzea atacamensis]|uniref:Uncharacterized protein n=1 Tax=Lentzea atacamensis TaxID=531938 RepID=A0ABX9DZR9_9PSEU|nr:hypothetical protein [Lentzea atacamensis]RAS60637.1 hypothetical protein C8D87_11155 [Lentzea atacamensis]
MNVRCVCFLGSISIGVAGTLLVPLTHAEQQLFGISVPLLYWLATGVGSLLAAVVALRLTKRVRRPRRTVVSWLPLAHAAARGAAVAQRAADSVNP